MRKLYFTLILQFIWMASFAQQNSASSKTYIYLIYHKLADGKTLDDAMPVEREWRQINQAAVDEGNMIGWYMIAKQMSSNPNPGEYDYISVIVTPQMGIKGASQEALGKIYGQNVQERMADLQKRDKETAPVIKMEVWETIDAAFSPNFDPSQSSTVRLNLIRLLNPSENWQTLTAPMKKLGNEAVTGGKVSLWNFSKLILPAGSEKGYSMAVLECASNIGDIVNSNLPFSSGTGPEKNKLQSQINPVLDVVRQETFRIVEYTQRKK